MVAEVHEALRDVDRADALRGEFRGARDELVFPKSSEGHIEDAAQPMAHIIRVQDRALGDLPQAVPAHPKDVRIRPDEEGDVPLPGADVPDRLRTVVVQVIAATVQVDLRHRQERFEHLPDDDGTRTVTATATGDW